MTHEHLQSLREMLADLDMKAKDPEFRESQFYRDRSRALHAVILDGQSSFARTLAPPKEVEATLASIEALPDGLLWTHTPEEGVSIEPLEVADLKALAAYVRGGRG